LRSSKSLGRGDSLRGKALAGAGAVGPLDRRQSNRALESAAEAK